MKKLYLVATLVWAAFMGNVGTEASANDLRKNLPVSTEAHPALRGNAGTIHVWEVEKKKEAAISQSSPLEAISQLASHTKADPLMKHSPWEGHVLQTNRPRSGKLYGLSVENGVILNPEEGETKIYKRSGGAYIVMQNQVMAVSQSSAEYLETVETADGTVYFKNILATLITDSWVKGTKVGNQIILPANQNLYYSDQRDSHLQLSWGARNGIAFSYTEEHPENFTFVIDGDSIALQGTDAEGAFMGAFWENDKSFFGYGDYETVLKPVDAEKKSHELVQLPDGVEAQPWILTTKSYTSDNKESYDTRRIKVAINGLNVYVRGLFLNYPNAWIKGMRIGTTVNFESYQYLGIKDGYEAWAIGLDVQGADDIRITDFSFQYNEEEGTLLCNTPVASNQSEFKLSIKDLYFGAYIEKFTPVEFTAPFLDSINTLDKFLNYETVDANKDGKTWNFDANNKVAVCFYSMDLIASDDWLITPAINLTADQLYTFRVDAAARTEKYPEKFVVKFGKVPTPEGLTQTLIDTTTTTNPAFDTYTSEEFKVEESGPYYVGIQCVSDPNMWRLAVSSLGVSLAVPGPVPAEITEATIHADAEGELKADVIFTAPDKDKKGETLEGDVHVILQVDEVTIDTVTMAPGATFTYPLTVDKPKSYVVTLIPYVVEGKEGMKTRRSAWIGEDIPAAVEDFKGRNIGSKVYFTWTAADKGVNGGVVKSETVTYNIYTAIGYSTTNGNIYIADSLLNKEPLTGTEYVLEDDLFAESDQSTHAYIIVAQNGAGKSEESTGYALVGKPYELPFLEDFDGVGLRYYWSAYGKISIDADDEDNYAVTLTGSEGTLSYLSSGMVSLKGAENPSLILDVASSEGTPLKVYIDAASGSFQQIGSFETTEEFVKQKISLKDYVDEEWIVFVLVGNFEDYDNIVLDNIAVSTLSNNNLAVYLSAPESVTMGVQADVKVSVENLGENSVSNYAVKVFADDQLVDEIAASDVEEVAFGETAEYEVAYTASLFSATSEVVLRAEVVFAADEDDTDNTDEAEITLLAPVADPVMTVAANAADAGLTITWQTTPAEEVDVLEDFESYEDQMIRDGQYLGRWLGYDVDQLKTYVVDFDDQEIEWPFDDELYAFCIWTPSLYTQDADNLAFTANGNKSLLFMGGMPEGDVEGNDDWLISPELTGKAQTISFQVSELDASYGEELYEVYYSTTDKEISSFILLAEGMVEDTELTERTYDLPEGAKYFAIRYVSEDIYSFIVDDIHFQAMSVETPTGYNIYVDEELVATVEADATSFNYESDLNDGTTYKVSVTALYGSRESLPVSAELAVSAIEELAVEQKSAEVYDLTGLRVRAGKQLKSGVYVIDGQKTTVK